MYYKNNIKRKLDFILSSIALLLLAPLFLLISIVIKLETKGPAIFTQNRVGENKQEFKIYKFRTMLNFEDSYYKDGTPIENYDRITKFGAFLRKTSLDELPQIINIYKGDMSIVGPRPTLKYQVEKYDTNQMKRLYVKPGLTGLAQVSGRNSLSWEEKIQLDLKYVHKINLLKDISIILKTLFVVLKKEKVDFTNHDDISKHEGDLRKDV